MKLTPLEIRQQTFEKAFRGYDKEEVDGYLQSLSVEWEKMQTELSDNKSKLEFANREVQKFREVESTFYKTLKTAEDTGNNLVDQANKTSSLLIKEAQMNSESIMNHAKQVSKNMTEEAEHKAQIALEAAENKLKEAALELRHIENIKENLLIGIKSVCNDSVERIEKYKDKEPYKIKTTIDYLLPTNKDDIYTIKNTDFKIVPTINEEVIVHKLDIPEELLNENEDESSDQTSVNPNNSFFDNI